MKGVGVGGLNPIWQDPSSTAGEGGGIHGKAVNLIISV